MFVDVLPQPPRPAGLPAGTIWQPKPRQDIPGSVWLPDTGYGELAPVMEDYFAADLPQATGGDQRDRLVFYCLAKCWMSWNAAKRALALGYTRVDWYPRRHRRMGGARAFRWNRAAGAAAGRELTPARWLDRPRQREQRCSIAVRHVAGIARLPALVEHLHFPCDLVGELVDRWLIGAGVRLVLSACRRPRARRLSASSFWRMPKRSRPGDHAVTFLVQR